PAGGAQQLMIVNHDGDAVAAQVYVELEVVHATAERGDEGRNGVLGEIARVAAMGHQVNRSGLAQANIRATAPLDYRLEQGATPVLAASARRLSPLVEFHDRFTAGHGHLPIDGCAARHRNPARGDATLDHRAGGDLDLVGHRDGSGQPPGDDGAARTQLPLPMRVGTERELATDAAVAHDLPARHQRTGSLDVPDHARARCQQRRRGPELVEQPAAGGIAHDKFLWVWHPYSFMLTILPSFSSSCT